MTITGQSSLAKDDIERMVQDAEAHAEDDRKRKEEAEVRNNADSLVYQTEKMLAETGDKIPADVKGRYQTAVNDLKDRIKGGDPKAIKASMDGMMKISEELYKHSQSAGGAGAGPAGNGQQFHQSGPGASGGTAGGSNGGTDSGSKGKSKGGKDGAVDADFEVVN